MNIMSNTASTTTVVDQDGSIITIEGPEPLVIDPAATKRRPPLDPEEARLLTVEIRRTSVRLWILITEAHDRAAHFALGYASWEDYVRTEFNMSPSRSYQLLDTGHVMRELAAAGADIENMEPPPTRVVNRIKNRLPEVRKRARQAVRAHEDPDKVIREMAREARPPAREPRPANGDAEPEEPEQTARAPEGRRVQLVTCPACGGDGKVTRSLANRLRTFMKDLTPTQ